MLECLTSGAAVGEQKVGYAAPIHDPRASAFDAHTRPAQGFAHVGERAGSILEFNRQVFHGLHRPAFP
jgi:hypothetical protein